MTPFSSEYTEQFVHELLEDPCPLKSIHKYDFRIAADWHEPIHTKEAWHCLKRFSWLSREEAAEFVRSMNNEEGGLGEDMGYEIWAGACLFDHILNGTDYGFEQYHYAEELKKLAARLEQEVSRTHFLSRRPVYPLQRILGDAVAALSLIMDAGDSELADIMYQSGDGIQWREEITELQERLQKHIASE